MTSARELQINLALEKAGGNRRIAAEILGMKVPALKAAIHANPSLKARWRRVATKDNTVPTPVTPAESLNRIGIPDPMDMSDEEKKAAEALNREDDLLREGLEKLNFTPAEQTLAFEFAAFNNRFFLKSADICMSGITVLGMKLQTEMADRKVRLDEVRSQMRQHFTPQPQPEHPEVMPEPVDPVDANAPPAIPAPPPQSPMLPFTREQLAEEEKNLMTSYDTLIAMADRIANTHLRGIMLQAMVKFRLRNPNGSQKPGFQERSQEKLLNGQTNSTGQHRGSGAET